MAGLLSKIFRRKGSATAGIPEASLEALLLVRFLKARRFDRAASALPDDLVAPVVNRLQRRREIDVAPVEKQLDVLYRVKDLKPLLKERGLPVSGNKPDLIERLLGSGFTTPGELASTVYQCTAAGRGKAEDWLARRAAAMDQAVTEAEALLRRGYLQQAIRVADETNSTWPSLQSVALQFNPIALADDPERTRRLVKVILSASPGILGDVSQDDIECLRMAVALWQIGLSNPGIARAMEPYGGSSRLPADAAQRLLLFYSTNILHIDGFRDLCDQAEVTMVTPCSECAKLDGKVYATKALPELPNPACVGDGCIFTVRPMIDGFGD